MTVLYADIAKSTELVARLNAEQAAQVLKSALDLMCERVERFEGTVFGMMGDGIVALFGAPHAQEGHAPRACFAALAIRDAFSVNRNDLPVRVGLHSGEVVADMPQAVADSELSAFGLPMHVGSRLPGMVEPGEICITEDTYRLARSRFAADPLGRHKLRGVAKVIQLFRLRGAKPMAPGGLFAGAGLATFRGRDKEMEWMRKKLIAANGGHGSVLGVVGAPGSGKSRLCFEFAIRSRGQSLPVLGVQIQPFGATPLQPIVEVLRSACFDLSPNDHPAASAQSIALQLRNIGSTFEADLPIVFEFLGIPSEQAPPSWLNPKTRTARLLDILRRLIRRPGRGPSVIVIEDLHWLDPAAEPFIETLADAVAATQTLLILNYRPPLSAPWMRFTHFHEIELAELSPLDTEQLLEELVGVRSETAEARHRIAERSRGNPFFAEELVSSMVEHGVLVGHPGDFRRGTPIRDEILPGTVHAVISARIDRLAGRERRVLQICAVIGKEFSAAIVQAVANMSHADVDAALDRLRQLGLLQPQEGAEAQAYQFRHPLIQEVAYATQLKSSRAALHASSARAIEEVHSQRLDEFAAVLSYHFEEAGNAGRAAVYASRAAQTIGLTNPSQAIKHWRKARSLIANEPRSRETDTLRVLASSQIAWLGWREGLTAEEARPFVTEALGWAREIDDSMVPLLLFVEGRITAASGGDADAYVRQIKQALKLMEDRRDAGRLATLNASLSQAYGWAGLLREALEANDAAMAGASRVGDFDHHFLGYSVEHWTQSLRGRILLRLGRFNEARACFDHMLRVNELIDPTVRMIAYFGYVELAWCLRDADMATEHLGHVEAIAGRYSSAYLRVYALACAGIASAVTADYSNGIRAVTEGVQLIRDANVAMEFEPDMLASLASLHLSRGDSGAARDAAKEAILIARQRTTRLAECRAKIELGAASLMIEGRAAVEHARRLFDEAGNLIRVTGARIYEKLLAEASGLLNDSLVDANARRTDK